MPARSALAPRKLLPTTLRGKLIAGLVALLTAACAAVGVVTYLAVQGSLSRELNSQLQTASGLAHSCWEHAMGARGSVLITGWSRPGFNVLNWTGTFVGPGAGQYGTWLGQG